MLSLVRRDPRYGWGLMNIRDELDRMFRNFYDEGESEGNWAPSVDITENKDSLTLSAEIPGVDKKDVKISLQNNVLTIEGEKKQEKEENSDGQFRSERFYGKFSRTFTLSTDIDAEKIKADFKNGVLTVTLPKTEKVKPRQIEIG
jgi:HSP20 family protein